MSGGGGGIIIIRRLLSECRSRLTADQVSRLEAIEQCYTVPLSREDAAYVGFVVYELCRGP